jgi:hypothetical protein
MGQLFSARSRITNLFSLLRNTETGAGELGEAKEVVQNAELFVQTVEQVFSLDEPSSAKEYENPTSKDDDKVSEPAVAVSEIERERERVNLEPISLEEIRRQARENWLQLRQRKIGAAKGVAHSKDADRGTEEDQGHSIDDDLDE